MQIDDSLILNVEAIEIITTLKNQLELNGVKRFYKTIDTPDNLMICCPFHKDGQERKPSMGIHKSDGICHCFACDWTGSLQELVSNCFGKNDFGAFGRKWLSRNFLSISVEERNEIDLDFSRSPSISTNNYVSDEELDKYRWTHPYWAKRGITNERLIELFDLGFDSSTECITFPIRDKHGNCVFVARRSVKSKYFNYPTGVEKPLYGLYEYMQCLQKSVDTICVGGRGNGKTEHLRRLSEVIVCESMIDALTCWQYGRYAVAMNGLGTSSQFKQLQLLPCRKLIIATDNDEAGMRARERIKQNVTNKILTQYMLPKGKKDINELTKEEFDNLVEIFL